MDSFLENCKAIALEIDILLDNPIGDGILRRYATTDKPYSRDGAALIYCDAPCSAYFKNWRTGDERTYTEKAEGSMTPEERQAFNARVKHEKEQREAERQSRYSEAQSKAQRIYDDAPDATDEHPYLMRKKIPSIGLKLGRDNTLIVPVLGADGKTQSLQFIAEDGSKRFLTGGRIQGGYMQLPAKDGGIDKPLCVAEGYATAVSINLATGYACLVAFNAGNLDAVARLARQNYPNRKIILCADNDHGCAHE